MAEKKLDKETFLENEDYIIRKLKESDKADYLQIVSDNGVLKNLKDDPMLYEALWKIIMKDTMGTNLAVARKSDQKVVASLLIKTPEEDKLEIGLDVALAFQQQGIGTEVIKASVDRLKDMFLGKTIIARVSSDNEVSQHVVRKAGGKKVMEELSLYDAAMISIKEQWEDMPEPDPPLGQSHIDVYQF